jgi:hypothetical protein
MGRRPRVDDRKDKKHTMPLPQRLEWLRTEIRRLRFVNILNASFVDDYVEHTNAPHEILMYGANRCPRLAEDLRCLYHMQEVSRTAAGVPDARSFGFPTWVWTYYLKEGQ